MSDQSGVRDVREVKQESCQVRRRPLLFCPKLDTTCQAMSTVGFEVPELKLSDV